MAYRHVQVVNLYLYISSLIQLMDG